MRLFAVLALAALAFLPAEANAGGFCGEGGVFRGDAGRLCDGLEKNVTTPIARGATVVITTATGTVVGGAFGNPVAGAAVGEYVGRQINERAAGRHPPIGTPARHGSDGKAVGEATFRIKSDTKYIVYVRLFSQDRDVVWPAARGAYVIKDYTPHDLTVQCEVGEKICYGAHDNDETYWGAGQNNEHACRTCCLTCRPASEKVRADLTLVD